MFCSNCGNKLVDGAKFCSFCGKRIADAEGPEIRSTPNIEFEEPKVETEPFRFPADRIIDEAPEKPKRERMAFDWSNVVEEPRKKEIPEIRSPWETTEITADEKPIPKPEVHDDHSRTMSFIDVLKAEKLEKEKAAADKAIEYTQVLEIGPELEAFNEPPKTEAIDEPPKLHFAPLYEDVEEHVVTPFDDPKPTEPKKADVPEGFWKTIEMPEAPVEEKPLTEEPAAEHEMKVSRETIAEFDEYVKSFEREAGIVRKESAADEPVAETPAPSAPKFELPDFLKNIGGKAAGSEVIPEEEADMTEDEPEIEGLFPEVETAEPEKTESEAEPVFGSYESEAGPEDEEADVLFEEPHFEEPKYDEEYIGFDGFGDTEDVKLFSEEQEEEPEDEPEAEEAFSGAGPAEPEMTYAEEPAEAAIDEEEPEEAPAEADGAVNGSEPETAAEQSGEGGMEDMYLDMDLDDIDRSIEENKKEEIKKAAYEAPEEPHEPEYEKEFEAVEAIEEEPVEEETADADLNNDISALEAELFGEMESSKPSKTGMTIAGPADTESEIEALKQRLAELTGDVPGEEPETETETVYEEQAEAGDELFDSPSEDLFEEEDAESYYDDTPAEDHPEFLFDSIATPSVDELFDGLTPDGVAATTAQIEDEYLTSASSESSEEPEKDLYSVGGKHAAFTEEAEEASDAEPVVIELPKDNEPSVEEYYMAEPETPAEPEQAKPEEEPAQTKPSTVDDILRDLAAAAYAPAEAHAEPEVPEDPMPAEEPEVEAAEAPAAEAVPVFKEEPAEDAAAELGVAAPEFAAAEKKESDALSLEELEVNLFGEAPAEEAEAEETIKIDKFYTLYRKNEEFQRLLDEEYDKLRNGGDENAEAPAEAAAEKPAEVQRVEDNKAYRQVEDETIYMPKEAIEAQTAAETSAVLPEIRLDAPKAEQTAAVAGPEEVKSGEIDLSASGSSNSGEIVFSSGSDEKVDRKAEKARKKEAKRRAKAEAASGRAERNASEVEYEDVESGSGFLTVLAVIIAIILVMLLAIILVLQVAPDSGAAAMINELIGRITQNIGAVDPDGPLTLL